MTTDKLKKIREKLGLTQPEMAEALNTPLSSYRKWEQGDRRVPGIIEVALRCLIKENSHGKKK